MKKIIFILSFFISASCFASPDISDTSKVNYMIQMADSFIYHNKCDSAIQLASRANELAQRLRFDMGVCKSLERIGVCYSATGEYPKALSYYFQSLKVSEKINDKIEIASVYDHIGLVYARQNDFKTGLVYLFKSLSSNENPLVYIDIGQVYNNQMKYDSAISFYKKALSYKISLLDMALILNDVGNIFEKQNIMDSAIFYYGNSLKKFEAANDEMALCDVNGSIGDLLIKQKKYREALAYELKSLEYGKSVNYRYGVKETEKALSEIYSALGDGMRSLEHYKNYVAIRDSMFNEENTKQTVRTEMNYQFDKKQAVQKAEQDKKDAVTKEKIKQQRIVIGGVIFGLALVLVFSIFLFRSYKQTRKAKDIIASQKKEVEHKNKEITDNINYAQRIQKAMLPSDEYMKNNMPQNCLIYKPKDIVSGDFYWAYRDGDTYYWATADCTGHGVSGAMMSMIGASLLNEIVIERKITSPDQVLNTLRHEIIKAINHDGAAEERKDGMDIVFCKMYPDVLHEMTLECACANNPIYIVRNGRVIKLEANKFPVGKYLTSDEFTLNGMQLQKNDVVYTFSDGFCDQFSESGKKLMSKRFRDWISEISSKPITEIGNELEKRFSDWMGSSEQIDDVTVLAIKI